MEGLTAHLCVRNEPFIYYAAMAVYPYVERMLLWDTGSYDRHTLKDIETILSFDKARKIDYREVPIQTDETSWNIAHWRQARERNRGKVGVGHVRQMQIDATHTRFFLIVDGDEVHYDDALVAIRRRIETWRLSRNVLCAGVPLRWFDTPTSWFHQGISGRVFRTDSVHMMKASPGEMHCLKGTNKPLEKGIKGRINIQITPYAHFETMLKPWRRVLHPEKRKPWTGKLPGVIERDRSYMDRFIRECGHLTTKAEIDGTAR